MTTISAISISLHSSPERLRYGCYQWRGCMAKSKLVFLLAPFSQSHLLGTSKEDHASLLCQVKIKFNIWNTGYVEISIESWPSIMKNGIRRAFNARSVSQTLTNPKNQIGTPSQLKVYNRPYLFIPFPFRVGWRIRRTATIPSLLLVNFSWLCCLLMRFNHIINNVQGSMDADLEQWPEIELLLPV